MQIRVMPLSSLQTNCYILTQNDKSLIIDPGIGAISFAKTAVNPVAVLNTHGHFDHVWSNHELKTKLNLPIYIHEKDEFFLSNDVLNRGTPSSSADVLVKSQDLISLEGFEFYFFHAPGHTPGCCMIVFKEAIFSGDFLFDNSIGRVDLPFGDPSDMRLSIAKFLDSFSQDLPIYPGHGKPTSVSKAKEFLPKWLEYI